MYVKNNLCVIMCMNIDSRKVLHATPDLRQTLVSCRSLLRTGGRLFLLELCTGK